jgi:predicted transcriptional regulator
MSAKKKTNLSTRSSACRNGVIPLSEFLINAAATGLSKRDMADLLGIHENTLHRYLKSNKDYQDAITKTDTRATRYMVSKMFEEAIGGRPYKKVVVKQTPKGTEITTTMGTTQPKPMLMMFWLTNRDNNHWKHVKQVVQDITENKKHTYELVNGDKVAQLAGAILGSNPDGTERKSVVSTEAPSGTDKGRGAAEDVSVVVCGKAADSVQDTPVDLSAEAGTEPA